MRWKSGACSRGRRDRRRRRSSWPLGGAGARRRPGCMVAHGARGLLVSCTADPCVRPTSTGGMSASPCLHRWRLALPAPQVPLPAAPDPQGRRGGRARSAAAVAGGAVGCRRGSQQRECHVTGTGCTPRWECKHVQDTGASPPACMPPPAASPQRGPGATARRPARSDCPGQELPSAGTAATGVPTRPRCSHTSTRQVADGLTLAVRSHRAVPVFRLSRSW